MNTGVGGGAEMRTGLITVPVSGRGEERFAVAREGETVSPHLGTCVDFTVFERRGSEIVDEQELQNMMLATGFVLLFFRRNGIETVLVGNSGEGLCAVLEKNGVRVVRGVEGPVHGVAREYAAGRLVAKDLPCTVHDACSGCGACH